MKKQSGSDLHQPSQEIPVYISETATPVKLNIGSTCTEYQEKLVGIKASLSTC